MVRYSRVSAPGVVSGKFSIMGVCGSRSVEEMVKISEALGGMPPALASRENLQGSLLSEASLSLPGSQDVC
jgi:hypothetical protein